MVPLRLKVCISCQHVFRAKRRAEHSLAAKAMKRVRVLQSDSVKSVTKAKDKLQKASKRASESSEQTLHRQEQGRERKASMRASETGEQTLHRQEQDRERKASMRASETGEQTLHRQEQNKKHMASMRASEAGEQTLHRQEQNKKHMASMRASEAGEQTLHRQEQNKKHMASMRAAKKTSDVSVQQAVMSFHSDIKNGPDFVCTCCHRLMYSKSVVPCNLAKYSKCSSNLLKSVFRDDVITISQSKSSIHATRGISS